MRKRLEAEQGASSVEANQSGFQVGHDEALRDDRSLAQR
jgi:uncharacterized protein with beta-barrel porin domain